MCLCDGVQGVSIQYLHGDKCFNPNVERSLLLRFHCVPNVGLSAIGAVSEITPCQYAIDIRTIYACPTECAIGDNRALCSSNGFCGLDTDLKYFRSTHTHTHTHTHTRTHKPCSYHAV